MASSSFRTATPMCWILRIIARGTSLPFFLYVNRFSFIRRMRCSGSRATVPAGDEASRDEVTHGGFRHMERLLMVVGKCRENVVRAWR
jgi:hypothetical protein